MKNKSFESTTSEKDYKKHIEEYGGRHFDTIIKEFSDYPLDISSLGKGRYPLDMYIETPQGEIGLFFEDPYVLEASFFPRKSS